MIFGIGDIIAFSYSSEPRQGVRDVKASRTRTQSGQTKWTPPKSVLKLPSQKERYQEQEKRRQEEAEEAALAAAKKQQKEEIHDKYPQVLVLHDNWQGRVHGINLNQLSQQEINYLTAIIDPFFAAEIIKKDGRIRSELQRLPKDIHITSPHDFYLRFIKPFIRIYDGYRLYNPQKMLNIKVIKRYKDIETRMKASQTTTPGQDQKTSSVIDTSSQTGGDFFSRYAQSISRMRGPRFK